MNTLDFLLLAIVAGFTVTGWAQGLLRQAVSLGAIYLAMVLAAQYHLMVSDWLRSFVAADATPRSAVGFILVFFWAVLFLSWTIRRLYPTMRITSIGVVDNLGGASLGLFTGVAFVSLISIVLGFIISVPWPESESVRGILASANRGSMLMPVATACAPALERSVSLWFPTGVPAIFSLIS